MNSRMKPRECQSGGSGGVISAFAGHDAADPGARLVLRKPPETVAIKHPLNFQQFGIRQGTLPYLGAVLVGRFQVKLAVVA